MPSTFASCLRLKRVRCIPIPAGKKESKEVGWPTNKIDHSQFENGYSGNMAFRHDWRTICLDIDNVKKGLKLPILGDLIRSKGSNWFTSGKDNRCKGLYLLPPSLKKKFKLITIPGVGQIRGGKGTYDVAPGSRLADGREYVWCDGVGPDSIPLLPYSVTSEIERIIKAQRRGKKVLSGKGVVGASSGYPHIDVYNKWYCGVGGMSLRSSILELGGYTDAGFNTLKRIGSSNRHAVVLYSDPDGIERCFNFSDTVSTDSSFMLLSPGLHDPYSVLSCKMGFDEARKWVCRDNEELASLVDAYSEGLVGDVEISSGSFDDDDDSLENEVVESKYTQYPEQVGVMGELVKGFMQMHPFITPEIAVVQAHALVSVLGGRVYTLGSGTGVVWTALMVGRTGIGKSFLLKHVSRIIGELRCGNLGGISAMGGKKKSDNTFSGNSLSTYTPVAAAYYTSIKNFVDDIAGNGSILSIRTESGQQDRSKAGDMARVRMLELELATQSGSSGFIAKGGQNDKIPAMFSPACTVIRETVLESTLDVDLEKNVDIAGDTGRRSHIVINPRKPYPNKYIQHSLVGSGLVKKLNKIFSYACRECSRTAVENMKPSDWFEIKFEDVSTEAYYNKLRLSWVDKENECFDEGDLSGVAFWSRLHEKVPAWSGRLAIMESVDNPIITKSILKCALASLRAEHGVFNVVKAEAKGSWEILIDRIVELLSVATTKKSLHKLYQREAKRDLLGMAKVKAAEWRKIKLMLKPLASYKSLSAKDNFDYLLEKKLSVVGVVRVSKLVAWEKWQSKSLVFQLVE